MDHPGFVRHPETGAWQYLGGISAACLESGAARREYGDFAMWDLPEFRIREDRWESRVCDDLAGCAALVCLLVELDRKQVRGAVDVVFTRAEEVGFLGAIELGRAWPFAADAVFVSLETSAPVPGVQMGSGPVIRAGDAISLFDDGASRVFLEVAREQGIPVQRALLDRGSCEATATQHYGIPSAGISILLGNYHNCTPQGAIGPECIHPGDAKGLVRLLVAVVESGRTKSVSWREREEKFEGRRKQHAIFWKASRGHFA